MFFKKKDGDALKRVYGLRHIEGVPGIPKNILINITLYPDRIVIGNNGIITIDRIKVVDMFSEKEVQEKGKSVLGHAAVGGLLLGPLGAVIGGLSGTGKKQKNKTNYFLSIEFTGIDGIDHVGIFLTPEASIAIWDFVKKLNKILDPEQIKKTEPHEI